MQVPNFLCQTRVFLHEALVRLSYINLRRVKVSHGAGSKDWSRNLGL